ncbi:ATP-dependent DNA ligase [Aeromicrobium camelliae]|uniref:DNA ligase (ATP) n=1 Tax=Aeromicrobium camelliae TaxID=1538144 RepID=A0A3N6ZPN3_9ACTN|nr:ATP-dependent DNA ligase [Aeromicrobium camelliae]RQN09017.1 ATP-dependent DNA ligase [Aeromicrobium camelliae]
MAQTPQTVSIDGRLLRLTNPDKVLYPATGTTKADVIAYYVQIAPVMLPHLAGRPVTRKRWVEGVGTDKKPGEVFFEKNLPDSAPSWIRRVSLQHTSHRNEYPVFSSPADLAWAGQVAALELHVPQWRVDQLGTMQNPDRLVLDLDPGPGAGLAECIEVAHEARDLLSGIGLDPVPVTSGSKGLHLYCAMDGVRDADYLNAFAKQLAVSLEESMPDLVVSSMAKSKRQGKVLVDWSQNNRNKTTICPYSLRGRARPTVALPRTWDELDGDLEQLELDAVLERMEDLSDPMAALGHSGPDRLERYRSMRDASATPEPVPADRPADRRGEEPIFVIQEHHARRLHWDFRLEHDGVLVSWALPKGVPTSPKENHLAVQTEDHPMEYATFAGEIPKGQYGAGSVEIWDTGTFTASKWRDDEVIATLRGQDDGGLGGEPRTYALIRTGENWLIHLMKDQQADPPAELGAVSPMLATLADARSLGDESEWAFEMKWDGVRTIAVVNDDGVRLYSRSGRVTTATYPEVAEELAGLPAGTVLDGEIVALNEQAVPSFGLLQQRMGLEKQREITAARERVPVTFLAFDVLAHEGRSSTGRTYEQRRAALAELDIDGVAAITPPAFTGSLREAVAASRRWKLEGVVAKRRDSTYAVGKRSTAWLKIKHQEMQSVVIGGWRPGASSGFGSLLLGIPSEEGLRYVGRVGTGFTDAQRRELGAQLRRLERKTSPFVEVPRDVSADAHWTTPRLVGEVVYGGWTGSGILRHASWRGLRKDLEPDDVHVESKE